MLELVYGWSIVWNSVWTDGLARLHRWWGGGDGDGGDGDGGGGHFVVAMW